MHLMEKTFFCTILPNDNPPQIETGPAHTTAPARQPRAPVFTCLLCPAEFRARRMSPFYCGKCQIYEMTEREDAGVHIKNHDKEEEKEARPAEPPQALGSPPSAKTQPQATPTSASRSYSLWVDVFTLKAAPAR
ncbi:myoneurin-like protein [Lates japonicus]|uniref:Myoneurin-like protein n=1 Tax=Lates japonicus TaxID=270547 RepID=A0AAD3R2Q5_LATJO|nr:myoneurin-like protein [Lates japonicus]